MLDELLEAIARTLASVGGDDDVDVFPDTESTDFDITQFGGTTGVAAADTALADIGEGASNDTGWQTEGEVDWPAAVDRAFAAIHAGEPAPQSSVKSMLDVQMGTLQAELGLIEQMSPEARDSFAAMKGAQIDALDTEMQAARFESTVRSDVADSMRELSESEANSYAPFTYSPAETGLTLSDVNVPVGEHEIAKLGNGVIEYDGKQYRRLLNGSYDRIK